MYQELSETNTRFYRNKIESALCDWIKNKEIINEWKLFTCTVVFRRIDNQNSSDRWTQEYKKKFLQKIRQRLNTNRQSQSNVIPIEYLFYFEYEEKSKFRVASKKCPNHIHSLIPIFSSQVNRFWSYDNNHLNSRLHKDLKSIDVVQEFLIEPVRNNELKNWMRYIKKQKRHDD